MLHGRPEKDWAQSAVFYQIYPMGFCGAPFENDGVAVNRIQKVKEWIPHLEKLGIGAIYFSPVFESDTHGYDTRDFKKIDCRLGTNQEFKEVCDALHQAGIRVVLDCVGGWMEEFSIDGLRLDVAYLLDENFMRRLHQYTKSRDEGFFLVGEMIHGDYKRIVNDDMLDSATNYECYKGLYSAFNSLNMFEIAHSLARQFGPEQWTLYKGMHLFSFADNHDVTRIASILQDKKQLDALYAVLFCMPGIPCVYYGSEWGAEGEKHQGDPALRPCFEKPLENDLTEFLGKLSRIKSSCVALKDGGFQNLTLRNKQWIFVRQCPAQTVIVAVNAEENPCQMECAYNGPTVELLTGEKTDLHGTVELPGYGVKIYKMG